MRKHSLALLLLGLSGCDLPFEHKPEQVKWAMVDKGKLHTTYFEAFKRSVPYPPELNISDETSQMVDLTKKQISQLEQDARENCRKSVEGNANTIPNRSNENETVILPSGEKIIRPKRRQYTSETSRPSAAAANSFFECTAKIQNDPLITELQNKLRSIRDVGLARGKFDQETRKKFETFIKAATEKYAQKKDFQLIIANSPENIVYSADKIYIQATDDLIGFISDNQLLNAQSGSNLNTETR